MNNINKITQIITDIEKKDMSFDDCLNNLRVISQLKEDQKLRIYENHLDIENRYFESILRYFYGDGREAIVDYSTKLIAQCNKHLATLDDKIKRDMLMSELSSSKLGFQNMIINYKDDAKIKAKILTLLDKIRIIVGH